MVAALSALLTGCGGSSHVDAGGFTPQEVTAGAAALELLGHTSVWTAAAEVTGTNGHLPMRCSVHVVRTKPLTFELFLTWAPSSAHGAASNRRYAWLRAVIGAGGLTSGYSFHLGYEPTLKLLATHYGDAYLKPADKCLVEKTGTFALIPADA
jgi:hypothetical protein